MVAMEQVRSMCKTCGGLGRVVDATVYAMNSAGEIVNQKSLFADCPDCTPVQLCLWCHGTKKCSNCAGWGWMSQDPLGYCASCDGRGSCPICCASMPGCGVCQDTGACQQCGGDSVCPYCSGKKCAGCKTFPGYCESCLGTGACNVCSTVEEVLEDDD